MTKKVEIDEKEIDAPYELPEGWKWVRLGDVADCLDSFRKPVNANERSEREGSIPYYGATGQVGWIDDYLTNEELVLLGEDGAPFLDLIKDKAYIISGKAWVNNHAHILRSKYGEAGNKYLLNYLNSFNYTGYVKGTTRLKLTQGEMLKIPFPLPPLNSQLSIVNSIESLFSKLDQAKEKAQSVVDSFETRKAAILHKAFTGELTKKWRRENGVSDESWVEKKLEELSEKIGDGLHGTPSFCSNGKYPFINGNNFFVDHIEIKSDTKFVDEIEYKKYYIPLSINTVFVSINGTLGKTAFYNSEEIILGKSACFVNVIPSILDKHFLRLFFESKDFIDYANENATGSTIKNLGLKAMRNLEIQLPSLPEQQEIVRILDIVLEKERVAKEAAEKVLDQIDLLKKSILARAFRGKI